MRVYYSVVSGPQTTQGGKSEDLRLRYNICNADRMRASREGVCGPETNYSVHLRRLNFESRVGRATPFCLFRALNALQSRASLGLCYFLLEMAEG